MPLINCQINLILTWSENCVISSATGATKFAITDTKLYVFVVTLSTQDNVKPLKQLECGKVKHESWVQIHELRVQIYGLQVQIHELRVQIH